MISEERSGFLSKQALSFPVGLLIGSPKRRLAKLGRKPSNGSVQSNTSDSTVRSAEGVPGVRQPAKSKIRRHNNRVSTLFNRSPSPGRAGLPRGPPAQDDPAELSGQVSTPGVLKIFGSDICQGAHYKSVLATNRSSAQELLKQALERYCLEREDPGQYLLCDVIGRTGAGLQWQRECSRAVADQERPLLLQALWRPKDGFSRRFEIQRRRSVEEQGAADPPSAGLNARRPQRGRSRVTSLFVDAATPPPPLVRSLSEKDLPAAGPRDGGRAPRAPQEETEETEESGGDRPARFSVRPPCQAPYLLLLQGVSHTQDLVVYLLSGGTTVFGGPQEPRAGDDQERSEVDVLLGAPDLLPRHCCLRRLDPAGAPGGPGGPGGPGEPKQTLTLLRPLPGALVTRNGLRLEEEVELSPGDLLGLGGHYLFMFKDPTGPGPAPAHAPSWMARLGPGGAGGQRAPSCVSCGGPCPPGGDRAPPRRGPCWRDPSGAGASLDCEPEQEERVLQEVLVMCDPGGPEPRLTPAFLLCLLLQRSAARGPPAAFRGLLLRMAGQIQLLLWEKTKELAATQGPREGLAPGAMDALGPGLRPLLLWMANGIELLHFVQSHVPHLLPGRPDLQDPGSYEAEMGATRTTCEEAMTVLEEVIMFTFQQTVYYLTKSMYPALPGLLDGNPFSESSQLRTPDAVGVVLEVLAETLDLLRTSRVHPDIARQLCAYLFYFLNASLFNTLMERGSGGRFYQWSRGVQVRANLDLLMDWVQGAGLGDLALDFFQKLSAAVNLLATPRESLLQASWSSLRTEFSALSPAQLHHMLREYNCGRACPTGWTPQPDETQDALRTADILESFESHPPLVLPGGSFQLDPHGPPPEPGLLQQLRRLQGFIERLGPGPARDPVRPAHQVTHLPSDAGGPPSPPPAPGPAPQGPALPEDPLPDGPPSPSPPGGDPSGGTAALAGELRRLALQDGLPGSAERGCTRGLPLDPSCPLTPPNTPQDPGGSAPQATPAAEEPEEPDGNTEDDDEEQVFSVELHRGPHGLGMALVDGTKTALRMSGIYVKSVVPGSPAARCLKLRPGQRILAVNGLSLVGMEYPRGRELIRSAGSCLKLLVASTHSRRSSTDTIITKC